MELISILVANYTHTVVVFLPSLFVVHVLIKRRGEQLRRGAAPLVGAETPSGGTQRHLHMEERETPGKASVVGDRNRKHNGASVSRGPKPER